MPPRPHSVSSPLKPPLPPRPRPAPAAAAASAGARLSTSFASLFGRAAPATPPASPQTAATPLQANAPATSPSESQTHAGSDSTEHVIGVPAFAISRRIIRKDVARSVLKALHSDIRAGLAPSGAPSWVAERLEEFAEREGLLPFVKSKVKNEDGSVGGYVMGSGLPGDSSMDDIGQRFQEFYGDVEETLIKRRWKGKSAFVRGLHFQHRHTSTGSISSSTENTDLDEKASIDDSVRDDDDTEKESEAEDHPEDEKSKRIREVVEAVEKTLCTVFYDRYVPVALGAHYLTESSRLFMQGCSDDATHDEALSSRIAAVNLLDLTLDHLGVDVGSSGTAVESVVKACGESTGRLFRVPSNAHGNLSAMTQLDAVSRSPADKAAVLVAAHKILVGEYP